MADHARYILGLDIGAASLGWAAVRLGVDGKPEGVLRAGVRIFDAGVEGDLASGREESRAAARREKRLQRRQLRRRAARQRDLFRLLQRRGLLPAAPADLVGASARRHAVLNALDLRLRDGLLAQAASPEEAQAIYRAMPYVLRRLALDRRLEPEELGRMLYHLIQRRGFHTNRKAGRGGKKQDEDLGKVKQGISELAGEIAAAGARTLGEYFSRLDPHQQRIRVRWTARRMFQDEFAAIWARQAPEHPSVCTPEFHETLERLLFFQRPIAAQRNLIGHCELEPACRRAPMWSWEAQQFRLLQRLNDLRVVSPGSAEARALGEDARQNLLAALERDGDLTWAKARKLGGLAKGETFNLERGAGKALPGNRTQAHMRAAFGPRWDGISEEERQQIVADWAGATGEEQLAALGQRRWGLEAEAARAWAAKSPEPDYAALSRRAIRKLLPAMTAGTPFKTAERDAYGPRLSGGEAKDRVPPVCRVLSEIRNPAVARALTETRKVVNAIVRELGKPHEVRLELARDLKKSRAEREQAQKRNEALGREREQAARAILAERGNANPGPEDLKKVSREDKERYQLAAECGCVCPYTGRSISMTALFDQSQFDVEHIIPYSRCPDDSFLNKTLCYHEENRQYKKNQTPWEAYGADPARWEAILARVRKFANGAKLRRFELKTLEDLEGFSARQLADTRYAAKLAAKLLGELYGGRDVEDEHRVTSRCVEDGAGAMRRAICASSGMVTASLRRAWGLEAILQALAPGRQDGARGKPRGDHRHHAIDAIVVALSDAATVQAMSVTAAAGDAWEGSVRAATRISAPWPDFVDSIRPHVEQMLVSHRPKHQLSGALHAETNYGPGAGKLVRFRKPVAALKEKTEIARIADAAVRAAVEQRAAAGPLKTCEKDGSWPRLATRGGGSVPIKKVRLQQNLAVSAVGGPGRERFVAEDDNHHVAIFARLDAQGREKEWAGIVVSRLEAADRRRRKLPVVCRDYPEAEGWQFKFSLMGGDTVALTREGLERMYRLRAIAGNEQLFLLPLQDGRLLKQIQKTPDYWRPKVNTLRSLAARKVVVDLLGRAHPASD